MMGVGMFLGLMAYVLLLPAWFALIAWLLILGLGAENEKPISLEIDYRGGPYYWLERKPIDGTKH